MADHLGPPPTYPPPSDLECLQRQEAEVRQEEAGGLELLGGRGGLAVGVGVGEGLGAPHILAVALHGVLVLHLLAHHAAQTLVLQLQLAGEQQGIMGYCHY